MSVITRIRTHAEIVVPFTPEAVWSVLTSVDSYAVWWPRNLRVKVANAGRDESALLGAVIEVNPLVGPAFRMRFEELNEPYSMRLRYFGGALEGPGGVLIEPDDYLTKVRYEIDVFVRAGDRAVINRLLPLEALHSRQLRQILQGLEQHLAQREEAAGRVAEEGRATKAPVRFTTEPRIVAPPQVRVEPSAAFGGRSNFEVSRLYLSALSSSAGGAAIARFFATDAIHEDMPSRFSPQGGRREPDELANEREESLRQWTRQDFGLRGATGGGSQVALEVEWQAEAAAGSDFPFKAGELVRARRALFLKFRDGLIVRQRAYDHLQPQALAPTEATDGRAPSPALPSARSPGSARPQESNFDRARSYLGALSSRAGVDEIADYLGSDVEQDEFPHALRQEGAQRDKEAMLAARARSLALLSEETYDLRGATGGGSQVAMEIHWKGTLSQARGEFAAGQVLKARFALFLKFRDGLIVRQRNYGGPIS